MASNHVTSFSKIEMFVPNPLRCFKCQRFGHGQSNCKASEACFKCGEEEHDGKSCQKDPKSRNCKGGHMASSKHCPIWKKEKEIQKVKVEKRIPYSEAKKLVNMYSVPKPNLTTYATVVKSSSLKDMSTQVSEKDLFQQASSCKINLSSNDKGKPTSIPASAGPAVAAAPKTVAVATPQPSAANKSTPTGRQNKSPSKNIPKQSSDHLPKGARDAVTLHNKFGVFEEMDITPCHSSSQVRSTSPKKNKGRISPISHNK
ncbi:uncharacterized protein LOC133179681 [Saccostrea echinata]|uniref:uncharacterized protein LOC133179681 n=1 Tax=Saccostrea echinata TaxID=191078 RepID=UPI002A7EEE66|nr:uncharacterized protein LOC133179681 [Saccostrea echinata]